VSTASEDPASLDLAEIEALRQELERRTRALGDPRWNADPDGVRRAVAKLVLTLVEFIRQLLERQSLRRMEAGTVTPEEIESLGLALMRLEETVKEIAEHFEIPLSELNLALGPFGKLL
jgi:hypothetical protein